MKKINELTSERADLVTKMESILANEVVTPEQRAEWTGFDTKVKEISTEIDTLKRQEELNKMNLKKVENPIEQTEKRSLGLEFRDFLKNAVEKNGKREFETRDWLASNPTDIIQKQIASKVDILTSPAESFLRSLGVTFYEGLTGNFVVPAMAQDTATFPGENTTAVDASMVTVSLTMAPRRVTHFQRITKETLAQTNPGIYNGIVQNLYNGLWNAITYDVFDKLETTAASQIGQKAGSTYLTYVDLLNMEASINALNIQAPAYITTPTTKAYLKGTVQSGTYNMIWNGNQVNGYNAYALPAANVKKVYFGDWTREAVGLWGTPEIIVDPYTRAAYGEIVLTIVGLVDTGCYNPRAFVIMNDSSCLG